MVGVAPLIREKQKMQDQDEADKRLAEGLNKLKQRPGRKMPAWQRAKLPQRPGRKAVAIGNSLYAPRGNMK